MEQIACRSRKTDRRFISVRRMCPAGLAEKIYISCPATDNCMLHHHTAFFLSDDAPIEEMNRAVSVTRIACVMRNHTDARAAAMQVA